jgi:colanic acid biosynthesis protein WcaH
VSVDLLVECPEGAVLGKRENKPVQGGWFVPGGRVQKGERLRDAVDRVALEELATEIEIRDELGVFEHFYDTSEVGCSKHYVAHGYHVWTDETVFDADDQHTGMVTFGGLPTDLYEYVEAYIDAAELRGLSNHSK